MSLSGKFKLLLMTINDVRWRLVTFCCFSGKTCWLARVEGEFRLKPWPSSYNVETWAKQ